MFIPKFYLCADCPIEIVVDILLLDMLLKVGVRNIIMELNEICEKVKYYTLSVNINVY